MHNTVTFRAHLPPQAAGILYYPMDVDDLPAAGGSRPDRLSEVRPQERVQLHTLEQIILAPMLDVPVPLMEEQLLVDAFAPHYIHVPEQAIEVPKIPIGELFVRTPVREPQLSEQLVEVPTILSFSLLQRIVEQNVDFPVPCGGVRGLQGFPPGQDSTSSPLSLERISERNVEQIVLPCLVEAFKIFVQARVQRVRPLLRAFQLVPWTSRFAGFFALFPRGKNAGLGPHSGSELGADFNPWTPAAYAESMAVGVSFGMGGYLHLLAVVGLLLVGDVACTRLERLLGSYSEGFVESGLPLIILLIMLLPLIFLITLMCGLMVVLFLMSDQVLGLAGAVFTLSSLVLDGLVVGGGIWSYCLLVSLVLSAVVCSTQYVVLFSLFSVLSFRGSSLHCSAPLLSIWVSTILMWSVISLFSLLLMEICSLSLRG